jgi:CRP-like cAMP-binding protein
LGISWLQFGDVQEYFDLPLKKRLYSKENGELLNKESYRLLRETCPDLKEPLLEFAQFKPWRADKKEILIQQGEQPTPIVRFMISGLARLFFIDDEGSEQTKFFLTPGFFLVPMHSLFLEKKPWFSIQASVICHGVAIDAETFKRLLRTDLQWANYWNCYMTRLFIAKENRERDLLTLNAREKYLDLLANFPEIAAHVPLHQIASYLGVTDVTLSRIRKDL